MRYRVTWYSLSSPVTCYAKMGVRMYEQPSCICLLIAFLQDAGPPRVPNAPEPPRSAPVPTLEGGANLH
eukprot:5369035-Prymnesium_polylepis.1